MFASCTDTGPKEYKCTCNKGYTGDGKTCTGICYDYVQWYITTKFVFTLSQNLGFLYTRENINNRPRRVSDLRQTSHVLPNSIQISLNKRLSSFTLSSVHVTFVVWNEPNSALWSNKSRRSCAKDVPAVP